MVKSLLNPLLIDLQLFSEGGAAGTGATGADAVSQSGETSPDAGVNAAQKTYTDADVQSIVKARVKTIEDKLSAAQQAADRYNEAAPLLEMLSEKYGTSDPSDVAALTAALENDSSLYEDEAMEMGVSVEHLKEFKKAKREAEAFKRERDNLKRQRDAELQTKQWADDAEAIKAKYGDFDLLTELQNPDFKSYLKAGIPMQKAYEAIHMDELLSRAMHTAASAARNDVTADIMARGRRPGENGLNSQSAADVKVDISSLSIEQIREYNARAARGEKITFI